MLQDLFYNMHKTLQELENDFATIEGIDDELSLLEKYFSLKEMSEKITFELNNLNNKIEQFEKEYGLLSESGISNKLAEKNGENIIEIDEEDFFDFQKGVGFYDLWLYDMAISHFKQTIDKYPDFSLARLYTAMIYFKKKEYNLAIEQLSSLIRITKDADVTSLAHNILGIINHYQQSYLKAVEHLKKAIELNNNWHEPKFNLAMVYYYNNRFIEAVNFFEELYHNNPSDWEVVYYLGKSYQKLSQYDIANEYFKRAYLITQNPKIIKQIAEYSERRGLFSEAVMWYRKWIDIEPNQTNAMLGMAKNLWLNKERETATAITKKLLSVDKNNPQAVLLFSWMVTDINDQKALNIIEEYFKINNYINIFDEKFFIDLANLYYFNRDLKKANRFSTMLINSSYPKTRSLGHFLKGLVLLDQNKN